MDKKDKNRRKKTDEGEGADIEEQTLYLTAKPWGSLDAIQVMQQFQEVILGTQAAAEGGVMSQMYLDMHIKMLTQLGLTVSKTSPPPSSPPTKPFLSFKPHSVSLLSAKESWHRAKSCSVSVCSLKL